MANTVSETVAGHLEHFRRERKLSLQQLADRCAELGAERFTFHVLAKMEAGIRDGSDRRGRDVSVDELLQLAVVMETSPLSLLLPADGAPVPITEQWQPEPATAVAWIAGEIPPPGHDREQRKRWNAGNGTVATYREWRRVLDQAARAEPSGTQALDAALREVARGVEALERRGLPVPALPGEWVTAMNRQGWLTDPDAVPVLDEETPR